MIDELAQKWQAKVKANEKSEKKETLITSYQSAIKNRQSIIKKKVYSWLGSDANEQNWKGITLKTDNKGGGNDRKG